MMLEASNKSVWSNVFWYVKACVFWKCIQYTVHWDQTQILEKFPLDKIIGAKNALFFLSQAPTHHSFTFNLHVLKHKVCFSKTVCGIFHAQKKWVDSLTLKCHNSFQSENTKNTTQIFSRRSLIYKLQNSVISA